MNLSDKINKGKLYKNVTDRQTIELAQNLDLDPYNDADEYPLSEAVRALSPWVPKKDVDAAKADFPKETEADIRSLPWIKLLEQDGRFDVALCLREKYETWFKKWFGES
jgi:hypothetical protein